MKSLKSSSSLVFICWLITNMGFAQTKEIDSLQNVLDTAKDTTEVNVLRFLGQRLRSYDKKRLLNISTKVWKSPNKLDL